MTSPNQKICITVTPELQQMMLDYGVKYGFMTMSSIAVSLMHQTLMREVYGDREYVDEVSENIRQRQAEQDEKLSQMSRRIDGLHGQVYQVLSILKDR